MFLFTLEFWLWAAFIVFGAGLVLSVLSRSAFLNFLGWMSVAAVLGGLLAVPIWVAQAYGFEMLIATFGMVLLLVLAGGAWLLMWMRRMAECVG